MRQRHCNPRRRRLTFLAMFVLPFVLGCLGPADMGLGWELCGQVSPHSVQTNPANCKVKVTLAREGGTLCESQLVALDEEGRFNAFCRTDIQCYFSLWPLPLTYPLCPRRSIRALPDSAIVNVFVNEQPTDSMTIAIRPEQTTYLHKRCGIPTKGAINLGNIVR